MFIVSINYGKNISEIEDHLSDHIEYLDRYYAAGKFIASGRKVPRTGGVILAMAEERHELDAILAKDPFKINNLANYDVTEFIVSKAAPQLAFLL